MPTTISGRNAKVKQEIFLLEMPLPIKDLLKCGMAKRKKIDPQEIFLGLWLDHAGIGPTEAAGIAGCTQSYISNISSGIRPHVNVLYLLKLSEHMGVTINDFFKKPPPNAQIISLRAFSPGAQEFLLRSKPKKRA